MRQSVFFSSSPAFLIQLANTNYGHLLAVHKREKQNKKKSPKRFTIDWHSNVKIYANFINERKCTINRLEL